MSEFEANGLSLPEESFPQLPAEVTEYLAHLNQRSANEALRQFGEEFGVKTVEVAGVRYLLAGDLARLVYGYEQIHNLSSLLEFRGEILKPLDRLRVEYGLDIQLREAFGASTMGQSPMLATWAHVLIAGTYGRADAAERVRDYIKRAELYARRQAMAITETGYSTEQIAAGMPQQGLTPQQLAEVKTIVVEAVTAAIEAVMLKALPAMVQQEVQGRMAALPPAEEVLMVTAGGFWRAREHEGFVSQARYVGIALARRLKGRGQKGRYPLPALERAFKAMVAEGLIHRPVRRTNATR